MLRIFGYTLALFAMVFMTGLHFAILQSIASVRMVVAYSKNSTLAEGLEQTLDGEHPCAMCLQIRQSQGEEKKKAAAIGYSEKKSEAALLLATLQIPLPTFSLAGYETHSEAARRRPASPAFRPPRSR
jgi:hypothetical protein